MSELKTSKTNASIMIIDDDETFARILGRSLQRRNWQVTIFNQPQEAIHFLQKNCIDHILLDLKLESDSGLRWISQIRALCPETHLLLLTGYASIATAVEAVKLGADNYLSKPIDVAQIEKALSSKGPNPDTPINDNPMSVNRLEWEHIQRVLNENNGNISATARSLNMHRRTLQRKLAKKPAQR
ncbi:MAG TPA: response regulator transcription factor [Aeromonadales bacterium]|nr:response regulator transcription factor [Aeromonadales bacterium]